MIRAANQGCPFFYGEIAIQQFAKPDKTRHLGKNEWGNESEDVYLYTIFKEGWDRDLSGLESLRDAARSLTHESLKTILSAMKTE